MLRLFIRTVNQYFQARDDGEDYADVAHARRDAIAAAAGIAYQELLSGKTSVIVEALVEDEANTVHVKVAIAICVSDLQLAETT